MDSGDRQLNLAAVHDANEVRRLRALLHASQEAGRDTQMRLGDALVALDAAVNGDLTKARDVLAQATREGWW